MIRCLYLAIVVYFATLVTITPQLAAAPPENADPALAPWFRSLARPDGAGSCCSESDCRRTQYRIVAGHYEALVDEQWHVTPQWIAVPPERILQRADNPTGEAVLCWLPSLGVLCFVRPAES